MLGMGRRGAIIGKGPVSSSNEVAILRTSLSFYENRDTLIYLLPVFSFDAEVEGIYVITSGVPDEPKVRNVHCSFYFYLSVIHLFVSVNESDSNKCLTQCKSKYSRLPITRTLRGNREKFQLSKIKLYRKRPEGKWQLLRVSGRFELKLSGVDCFLKIVDLALTKPIFLLVLLFTFHATKVTGKW